MSFNEIIIDIKTYLSIKLKNNKRFKQSKIESYVPRNIEIGPHCKIKKNVLLSDKIIRIGMGTYIGDYSSIFNCTSIGNYCSISHGVKVGIENHQLDNFSTNPLLYKNKITQKPTIIGNDVLISANAMILAGVEVGTGSVIGAGAFVNQDVPPYAIVVGIPGKILRFRFENEKIIELLNSRWWLETPNELNNKY